MRIIKTRSSLVLDVGDENYRILRPTSDSGLADVYPQPN